MKKLIVLFLFGIVFGLLEAIVVIYIQQIVGSSLTAISNYHTILNLGVIAFISTQHPILHSYRITNLETLREATTIIMLFSFGYMAGKSIKQKLGAFFITFAVWDICYYLFLILLTGWPKTFFDIDVYFLIPVAWVGPVITPLIISVFMLLFGTILYLRNDTSL
jgi:hypothetical protein